MNVEAKSVLILVYCMTEKTKFLGLCYNENFAISLDCVACYTVILLTTTDQKLQKS